MPAAALTSPPSHRRPGGGERHQEKQNARTTNDKTPEKGSEKAKNVSHVPCKFFRQSMCQAGDKCPFSHEVESDAQAVCKYFQKGNCKFGSKCALAHITADGRQVNKRTGKESTRRRERHRDEKRFDKHFKESEEDSSMAHHSDPVSIAGRSTVSGVFGSPSSGIGHNSETSAGTMQTLQPPFGSRTSFSQTSDTSNADSSVELASCILSKYSGSQGSPPNKAFQAFGMRSLSMSLPRRSSSSSSANWGTSKRNMNLTGFAEGSAIIDDEDDVRTAHEEACEPDEEEGYTEQLVPSALQDLLTPMERERRNSRTSQQRPGRVNSSPASSAANGIPASLPLLASMASPTSAPVHPIGFNTRRGSTSSETVAGQAASSSSLWSPRHTAAPFYKPGPFGSPPIPAASLISSSTHPPQTGPAAAYASGDSPPRQAVLQPAYPAGQLPEQYTMTPIGSGTNMDAPSKSPAARYTNLATPLIGGSPANGVYRPFQQYHRAVPTEKF